MFWLHDACYASNLTFSAGIHAKELSDAASGEQVADLNLMT